MRSDARGCCAGCTFRHPLGTKVPARPMKTFGHRIVAHLFSYHPLICLNRRLDTDLVLYLPQRADNMLKAGKLARADQMKRLIDKAVLLHLPSTTCREVGKEWSAIV